MHVAVHGHVVPAPQHREFVREPRGAVVEPWGGAFSFQNGFAPGRGYFVMGRLLVQRRAEIQHKQTVARFPVPAVPAEHEKLTPHLGRGVVRPWRRDVLRVLRGDDELTPGFLLRIKHPHVVRAQPAVQPAKHHQEMLHRRARVPASRAGPQPVWRIYLALPVQQLGVCQIQHLQIPERRSGAVLSADAPEQIRLLCHHGERVSGPRLGWRAFKRRRFPCYGLVWGRRTW